MAIIVSMRVGGIDFHDEDRIERIETALSAVSFVRMNGATVARLRLAGASHRAFDEATELIHQIRSLDDVRFVEVLPRLVNTSDIARLTGVTRQAVNKWVVNSELGFPVEKDSVGGGEARQKIWSLYAVNEWLSEVMGIDLGLDLPPMALVQKLDGYLALEGDLLVGGWSDFYASSWSSAVVARRQPQKVVETVKRSVARHLAAEEPGAGYELSGWKAVGI